MAKSKSGGTRAMIRGRVGSDVYSIGKDGKGKKQQVVRSLAETVANPQTVAQMRGRMIMSTLMQAVSVLRPIIDHSFDNVSGKRANVSEFINRNYALIKADVANFPAGNNKFGLNLYGEKGAKQGAYIVSDGKAAFPAAITFVQGTAVMTIAMSGLGATIGALREAWEVGQYGYLTIVGINQAGEADYARLHLDYTLDDSTALTAENINSVFTVDGDSAPVIAINGMNVTITLAAIAGCSSVIVTRKTASGFIHSKAVLGAATGISYNADAALPSYPIGSAAFLNGGSVDGGSVPVTPSPAPTPEPETPESAEAHLSSFSVAGANLLNGTSTKQGAGSCAIVATLADRADGKAYAIVRKIGAAFVQGAAATDNAVAIEGTSLSSSFEIAVGETHYFALTEDGNVKQVLGALSCVEGDDHHGDDEG